MDLWLKASCCITPAAVLHRVVALLSLLQVGQLHHRCFPSCALASIPLHVPTKILSSDPRVGCCPWFSPSSLLTQTTHCTGCHLIVSDLLTRELRKQKLGRRNPTSAWVIFADAWLKRSWVWSLFLCMCVFHPTAADVHGTQEPWGWWQGCSPTIWWILLHCTLHKMLPGSRERWLGRIKLMLLELGSCFFKGMLTFLPISPQICSEVGGDLGGP